MRLVDRGKANQPLPPGATALGLRFAERKWNLRILAALLDRPCGFNGLVRCLPGISQNTLAQRLDDMEELGLVERRVLSVTPPGTLYVPTDAAVGLRPVIEAMCWWAATWLDGDDDGVLNLGR